MARMGITKFPRIRVSAGSGHYILLPVLTTTQRDALSPATGWVIYNSTTGQVENYNGSSWVATGKVYGDATFLKLTGGTMSGNIAFSGAQTVDGVDVSVHADDIDAHMSDMYQTLRTGEYYNLFCTTVTTTNNAVAANQLAGIPFWVPRAMTFDKIAVHVSVLKAGSNIRLGIYNVGTNLYPGTLVLDAGVVSGASTGVKPITISQSLSKGLYFLAYLADDTPSLLASHLNISPMQIMGFNSTNFTTHNNWWYVPQAYGALPNPFTAGGLISTSSMSIVALRLLSLD